MDTASSIGVYYSPAVEDVHEGDGEDVGLLGSREVGDVSVQGDALQHAVSIHSNICVGIELAPQSLLPSQQRRPWQRPS